MNCAAASIPVLYEKFVQMRPLALLFLLIGQIRQNLSREPPFLQIVDKFGDTVSVIREECEIRITCKPPQGTLLLFNSPAGNWENFSRFYKHEQINGRRIFHIRFSEWIKIYKSRFQNNALYCAHINRNEPVKKGGINLYHVGIFYHLCGKEDCRKAKCHKGDVCLVIGDGEPECIQKSKNVTSLCEIHKTKDRLYYVYTAPSPMSAVSETSDDLWSECHSLLHGKTPLFEAQLTMTHTGTS